MTTPSSAAPARRADLDGLRGLAVLLVVGFHAGLAALRGAFVAVDVFFVLSGFFIATALSQRLATGEAISPRDVFARRVWRLLPALVVVLLATLAITLLLFAPIDRARVARYLIPVAFFAGNLSFAANGVNYFHAGENPVLHTWTLGVEIQLALLFPVLVLACARRGAARAAGETETERRYSAMRSILFGIAIAGLLSFLLSVWSSGRAPLWAYFGPHTRLWAFCAGAALALFVGGGQSIFGASPARIGLVQLASLAAIFIPALLYDRTMPYPGVIGLAPVAGTLGLLAAGGLGSGTLPGRVLALRPLAWAGRFSYPWYLWHWPLMVLGAVLIPGLGPWGRVACGLAALPLAVLTARLLPRFSPGRPLLVAGAVSLGLALLAGVTALGSARYVAQSVHRRYAAARDDHLRHDCWSGSGCVFGAAGSKTTIALLGDSHAEHWLGGLGPAAEQHGWRIEAYVMGGCPVADFSRRIDGSKARQYGGCSHYREAVLQRLEREQPSAVILSSFDYYIETGDGEMSEYRVSESVWTEGLRRTYSRLSRAGIRVIAMRGTPRVPFDVPSCLSRRAAGLPFATDCSFTLDREFIARARRAQDRAAAGLNVRFLDLNDQVCGTAGRCETERGGLVLFTDDNHLTASFARSLAPELGERLQAALRNPTNP